MGKIQFISEDEIRKRVMKLIVRENNDIVYCIYDYLDLQMPDELELLVGFLHGTIEEIEVCDGEIFDGTVFKINVAQEDRPFVIEIKKGLDLCQRRFEIAYGLGRYFWFELYSDEDEEFQCENLDYVTNKWIVTNFAEQFLVPEFRVSRLLGDNGEVPSIEQVSETFGVSTELAEKRLKDLKLIF